MVKSEHSHTPETERRIERERERSVTITRPCCTDQHLLVFDIVFFVFFFFTLLVLTHMDHRGRRFSPVASRVRCVSDHRCSHSIYQHSQSTAQSSKKRKKKEKRKERKHSPTAHRGEQKTTKFTPSIIALGNIRAKCSPKDLQEVKQFPPPSGRDYQFYDVLKTNCCFSEKASEKNNSSQPQRHYERLVHLNMC